MIRSYGLHWRADRVIWGKKGAGHSGTLLGAASRSPKAHQVDFREQRGIYALYAEYELVYLGQTGASDNRLFSRLKSHRKDHLSERWDRFSWFGTQWVTAANKLSKDTAAVKDSVAGALNIMEAVSIAIAEPRLNLSRGVWGDATKYFQHWKDYSDETDGDEED